MLVRMAGAPRRFARPLASGCLLASVSCGSPVTPSNDQIGGIYLLKVETGCAALPAEVRTRTYVAEVVGNVVTLSGATFWTHPSFGLMNKFRIGRSGDAIPIALNLPAGSSVLGVIEETGPGRYFHMLGLGTGRLVPGGSGRSSITGSLSAGFAWGTDMVRDSEHVGCASSSAGTFEFAPNASPFVTPGVALSMLRLEVAGPASVAPGETVQFQAVGHFTDGSTSDQTGRTEWGTNASHIVRVTPTGLASGIAFGEAPISTWRSIPNLPSPLVASREIVVVPANTFRVSGRVLTGTPPQAVFDAEVVVASGPAAGLSVRTAWDGGYALYGVSGATEIHVSKPGYLTQTRSLSVQSHQTLDVVLPNAAVPNVSGSYSLTVSADQSCSHPLPSPLDVRTYTATLAQNGRDLTVTLAGASFLVREGRGNGFPGTVDPQHVTFLLDDNDHFGVGANPDVVEFLGGTRVLMLFGTIIADIAPNRLSGRLSGEFIPADRAPQGIGFFWGPNCSSAKHQVVFSR